MVPKTGGQLPKNSFPLSDAECAATIGKALRADLGSSRRATKTLMSWTGVSDHTARAWLNGRASPSARHLIVLAAHCHEVMVTFLRMTGREQIGVAMDLSKLEVGLQTVLQTLQILIRPDP